MPSKELSGERRDLGAIFRQRLSSMALRAVASVTKDVWFVLG